MNNRFRNFIEDPVGILWTMIHCPFILVSPIFANEAINNRVDWNSLWLIAGDLPIWAWILIAIAFITDIFLLINIYRGGY